MIPLTTIEAANDTLATRLPSPVCVFAGGTTGIGSFTLKKLAAHTVSPRVYFIGRTAANGEKMKQELEEINPKGTYIFLSCDIILTKNIDKCCQEILKREKEINLLWLSVGMFRIGEPDTADGINFMAAVSYFSQFRFVHNLLPLLKASAANPANPLTRVIRILAGGLERALDPQDLSMSKANFMTSRLYHITMNTVAMDHLAKENPEISFVHAHAGMVKTEGQTFPGLFSLFIRSVMAVAGRWILTPADESGERNLFYATSDIYPPGAVKVEELGGEDKPEGKAVALGLDGVKGSGCYTLTWDGTAKNKNPVLLGYRKDGTLAKVWEHTLDVWKRVEEKNRKEAAA